MHKKSLIYIDIHTGMLYFYNALQSSLTNYTMCSQGDNTATTQG